MSSTNKRKNEDVITVGSCQAYIMEWDDSLTTAAAMKEALFTDGKEFGRTKNGCTIRYSSESTELTDDLGYLKKTITSEESATVALGLFGWNGDTMAKMIGTARATDDDATKLRTVKIGGIANDTGEVWLLGLYHHDATDGDAWWMIKGKNTEGFELGYVQDDGVTVNPTFTAQPIDGEGTLIYYIEQIGTVSAG